MRWMMLTVFVSVFALACGGEAPHSEAESSEAPPAAQEPAAAPGATSEAGSGGDLGMVSSRGTTVQSGGSADGATAGGTPQFNFAESWQEQAPSSSMRLAQASLPGEGDAGDAELAVFFFGPGGGGGVEQNLQRWIGQVVPGEGEEPFRDSFQVADLKVTWVELGGTLKAAQFGMGPSQDQPGSRLIGAVIEGEGGPWFVKVTGPEETVMAHRDDVMKMLKSLRGT